MHSPHPALVPGAVVLALELPLHSFAVAAGNGLESDDRPADLACVRAALAKTSALYHLRLTWRKPAQMTPARALRADLRQRRRSLVRAGRRVQTRRDLATPLPIDLQGDRLLHLLQARARDDQGAEAARRSIPPRRQHDVHVLVSVAPR